MSRNLDNLGPSTDRIDALIDALNTNGTNNPDIEQDLAEIATTIQRLQRHRTVVWPERVNDVPRSMAERLAAISQATDSPSNPKGALFAGGPAGTASGRDRDEASDRWPDDEPTDDWRDVADTCFQAHKPRAREALRIAAAIVGFGIVAAALITIFQPGDRDQGLGADHGPSTIGEILYVGRTGGVYDVMVIDDDGSNPRNLTNDPAVDCWPEWSPDGQMIAFNSDRDGSYRIYVMEGDGSGRRPVTASIPGDQFMPEWSPDGSQLAFLQFNPPDEEGKGRADIAIVDLTTGSWRTVAIAEEFWDRGVLGGMGIAWSPDGAWLAFARGFGADADPELAVVRPAGTQIVTYQLEGGFAVQPAWSPDGRYLAYGTSGTSSELIIRDFLTDKVIQSVRIAANQIVELTWSPDGSEVFFSTAYTSTGDILKTSVATGEISEITDWIGREYIMDLSSDGSRIVVLFVPPVDTRAEDGNEASSELIVMNVDGTDRQVLATNVDVGGSWRPQQ